MAKFRLITDHYLNDRYLLAGSVVDIDPSQKGKHMVPVEDDAQVASAPSTEATEKGKARGPRPSDRSVVD